MPTSNTQSPVEVAEQAVPSVLSEQVSPLARLLQVGVLVKFVEIPHSIGWWGLKLSQSVVESSVH